MLEIKPPNFLFCPFCGRNLEIKLEEDHQRKFCAKCNWTYYPHVASSVGAVIIKNGEVLLVKRNRGPYRGTWMFPAGFIEFGEHPEETLRREVSEETGLKLKKATLLKVMQSEDDPRSPGHFLLFYKVTVSGSKLKTDKEENQGIGWFDLENPPKIGWQSHRYILGLLKDTKPKAGS